MSEVIRINEETYRIEDEGVRFFLLTGKNKAMMIDSGMNTRYAKAITEELTSLPIELLNTHGDRDHICGNGSFDKVYMSEAEKLNYIEAGGRTSIISVKEGDVFDLGERTLKIIDNPGHTPGSIAILDEKYRVLIGGDAIQDGTIYMFGKYRNINLYVKSLRHIKDFLKSFDVIYPSHGSFPVYPELIDKLIEGATSIINKQANGSIIELHGRKVIKYEFPYAGFYCDINE
ncbi:MAG: MBL fold metallo-hydrolase [Erysipelotrichaceae bacterium]|nr:MBL fold metallo-hydrolase [Erysipelotrichaceae bacterium]